MSRSARRLTPKPRPTDPRTASRQIARQQEVLQVLLDQRGEPLAVDALAERLGVSERTVERDLERLRSARLPLRGRGGQGGGVWLDVTRSRGALRLDDDQVMALVLALDFLDADLPERLLQTRDQLRRHLADPSLF
ncbi:MULTISPECIES: HTH domain-containing protein [unclassified Luteococcus]|uniref:HTH domain-containing protein n=1 Tax=unclassified Luteococcus TaxID=2639923 RepID=UPI00313A780D